MMLATIMIAALIGLYAGWVLYQKYRQWKAGQYCSCGCGSCKCRKSKQCEK